MSNTSNIFIVEDSKSMSLAIEKHLLREFKDQIIVHQFSTVAEVLKENQIVPDMMLLDHNLQESKGVDSIRTIIKKHKELKIAIISGQNDIKVFTKAYSDGALEYIRKDPLLFHGISDFIKLHS